MRRLRQLTPFALLGCAVLLAGCGGGVKAPLAPVATPLGRINGTVHGGQQPVSGATIQLYTVGTAGDASAATPLLTVPVTTSDGSGNPIDGNGNLGNGLNSLPHTKGCENMRFFEQVGYSVECRTGRFVSR